ncbi:MAG: hypothetical protein JWR13_2280 [Mycobacterium sp.]|jgi:hypothetical protein|nr:hypothetical protein [Mycobacterium sp.]MCW2731464.1 hypothetical protein [Mycobacterium sp.]MDT5072588.1 hypothetical protein [Mycobacterium sp.]MDT5311856.1 hypothetical protein [Mycobacterium sp.]
MTPPDGTAEHAAATEAVETSASGSRTNRTAIASLVSSVVTLFGIGSIIGIGLGVYALNQIAVSGENGRGLAIAGIFLGALTLLLSMIGIVMGLNTL